MKIGRILDGHSGYITGICLKERYTIVEVCTSGGPGVHGDTKVSNNVHNKDNIGSCYMLLA